MTNEEKVLLEQLSTQMEGVVETLLKLRKPSTAFEIAHCITKAREILQWMADVHGLIKFA